MFAPLQSGRPTQPHLFIFNIFNLRSFNSLNAESTPTVIFRWPDFALNHFIESRFVRYWHPKASRVHRWPPPATDSKICVRRVLGVLRAPTHRIILLAIFLLFSGGFWGDRSVFFFCLISSTSLCSTGSPNHPWKPKVKRTQACSLRFSGLAGVVVSHTLLQCNAIQLEFH